MLVLLGPPFSGTDADYARLAQVTGLVAYDLRTRLKPETWGVVRVLADPQQAGALAAALAGAGYRACVVDPMVGHDPARAIVPLRTLELLPNELTVHLRERSMTVPYSAVLALVRGEVQIGARPQSIRSSSSATFRAVVPSAADLAVFREQAVSGGFDAYAAADIHFVTVPWVARIDVRSFDFSPLGQPEGTVQDLDRLVDVLAERTGARVDRASRISSVASFAGSAPSRVVTPPPGAVAAPRPPTERFDFYSRVVAEAERRTRGLGGG